LGADSKFGIHFLVARHVLELQRKFFLGIRINRAYERGYERYIAPGPDGFRGPEGWKYPR